MHGNDVWVMQHGLQAWGKAKRPKNEEEVRRYAPTGNFGKPTTVQVKHFQKLHAVDQTGVVGQKTWNLLEPFFNAKDVVLAEDFYDRTHALDERQAVAHAMMEAYAHRYHIQYRQYRPSTWSYTMTKNAEDLKDEDCSSLAKWGYFVGTDGKIDPCGYGYSTKRLAGTGNTDSMLNHGKWIPFSKARIGDLVLYRNPGHVATVTRVDYRGIYVVSNGHYPMAFTHYNYGHSIVGCKSYL